MKINSRIPSLQEWKKEHGVIRNNCIPGIKHEEKLVQQPEKYKETEKDQETYAQKVCEKIFIHLDSLFVRIHQKSTRMATRSNDESKITDLGVINLIMNSISICSKFVNEMHVSNKSKALMARVEMAFNNRSLAKPKVVILTAEKALVKNKSYVFYFFNFDLNKILKIKHIKRLSHAINKVENGYHNMILILRGLITKMDEFIYIKMEKIAERVSIYNSVKFRPDIL